MCFHPNQKKKKIEKIKVDSKFTSKRVWKRSSTLNWPWNLEDVKKTAGGKY